MLTTDRCKDTENDTGWNETDGRGHVAVEPANAAHAANVPPREKVMLAARCTVTYLGPATITER